MHRRTAQPSGAAAPKKADTRRRACIHFLRLFFRWRFRRQHKAALWTREGRPPRFTVCAVVCDSSPKAECVSTFRCESECGAFVPEVLKTVWTMCWKRWYDCVSCAFHGFFEDEKESRTKSRIKGWRRKRRRSRHFCPQCGQLTGVSTQSVVASFEGNFRAAGVLVPANAGVPRILVVPYGRFGRKLR